MSELSVILADLSRIGHAFDLDRGRLGEDALDVVADGIAAAMDAESDPDGVPWPELSEWYAERKAELAPGAPMAVLYGTMKTPEHLAGERAVSTLEARSSFGVDAEAKQEAEWFQEGRPPNQPPRPFYAIPLQTVPTLDAIFDQAFEDAVEGR